MGVLDPMRAANEANTGGGEGCTCGNVMTANDAVWKGAEGKASRELS